MPAPTSSTARATSARHSALGCEPGQGLFLLLFEPGNQLQVAQVDQKAEAWPMMNTGSWR
jgi:hypothetical protein